VIVTRLTIYGDFNCPFSALASVRADLLAGDDYEIDWRAVQHDTTIPADGEVVDGETCAELASEVAKILELSAQDVHLELVVPPVRSNTAAASAAFAGAGDDADRLRRQLFAAVWAEGSNIGEFEALPEPITPSLVLPDGYVSRGLGALARLADLVAATGTR
jgi:predicted DsbA family dithiol-disulfide isomerase